MINFIKKIAISILYWFNPPKIGQIQIEPIQPPLNQNVRRDQDQLEVNLDDWQDMIKDVFETDNFAIGGFNRANRPSDEVLKQQIQSFFKDYRRVNGKINQLYTKTVKPDEDEDN